MELLTARLVELLTARLDLVAILVDGGRVAWAPYRRALLISITTNGMRSSSASLLAFLLVPQSDDAILLAFPMCRYS